MATTTTKPLSDSIYENALQQVGTKPTYAGTFEGQLNDIYNKIQNREPFNYDVNADPLYQSYKDQYVQQGKLAMKDTMGQAAALTGGYGNTYGQQVGQQAYNAYLQNLSAVIPELYGMAYNQYKDAGDDLKDQYAMVGDLRDKEYDRFRNELGDWERDRAMALDNERYEREFSRQQEQEDYNRQQTADEIARQLEQQEYNRRIYSEEVARELENRDYTRRMAADEIAREQERQEYNRRMAAEEIARQQEQQEYNRRMAAEEIARQQEQLQYNRRRAEDETAYQREQDQYNRLRAQEETAYKAQQQAYSNLYALIKASGYRPTDSELAAAGMTRAAADALASEYQRSITPTYSSGSGGSGSSGSGGSRSSGSSGRSSGSGYNGGTVLINDFDEYGGRTTPTYYTDYTPEQQFLNDQGYNIAINGQNNLATRTASESHVNRDNSAHWSTVNDRAIHELAQQQALEDEIRRQKTSTPTVQQRRSSANVRKAYESYL